MSENPHFIALERPPAVAPIFSIHSLVEAIRSIRPPIRNRRYYLGIPVAILSTVETSVQAFEHWQDDSVEKAVTLGLMGVASFLLARKLLNRFYRLDTLNSN